MIAAKHQGEKTFGQRLLCHFRQAAAGFRNLIQIFGALFAVGLLFRLLYGHVTDIVNRMPKLFKASLQTGDAQSRRTHVHAAAALAEVHRHADDANLLRHDGYSVRPNRRAEEPANKGAKEKNAEKKTGGGEKRKKSQRG